MIVENSLLLYSSVEKREDTAIVSTVPQKGISDERLVHLVLDGHQEAFETLLNRYQRKALAVAFNMTGGNLEDARDLTQDAFIKAFNGLSTFRHESSFSTWFYKLVINRCHDFNRRQRLRNLIFRQTRGDSNQAEHGDKIPEAWLVDNRSLSPYRNVENREMGNIIRKAIAELPEKQRDTFILKNNLELSINEISQITGMASGTIKSHLFRATRKLQEKLGPILERDHNDH